MDAYAGREHLYSREQVDEDLHRDRRKFLPVAVGYVIAILIGLAAPLLAMALYFGLALYLVVPFREVGRLLFPRSRTLRRHARATGTRGCPQGTETGYGLQLGNA